MLNLDEFVIPDDLLDASQAASANPYLSNPALGMGLIARLLAAPAMALAATGPLARLRQLIHEEFAAILPFCGPSGLTAARELAAIAASIEELALFPDLANKVVVGIGGGFSAGKSRFLNTLLGMDLLPEGLGPTTAIPTCLVGGGPAVRAQNLINSMVPVNAEELQALAHGFDRQYQPSDGDTFGLAHLIRLLVIQEPLMRWHHLALLDTPGYDKPEGEQHALTDEDIARQQLSQADHVVWLVNARNGTLRGDDIHFLQSVQHRRPVFFVVTQSDLQAASALPAILRAVEDAATSAGIDCAGVMAWSAPQAVRHGVITGGPDISQWLDALDQHPRFTDKRRRAARLMDSLSDYLQEQLDAGREELALLNAFWPVAQQLPDDTADGMRRLVAGKRDSQREYAARILLLQQFRRDLDAALTAVLDTISLADAQSEEAIEQQYQDAMLALRARHEHGREQAAFASLLEAARHDHVHAQYALAECYRLGTGTVADPVLAFIWYRKAAGHGMAQAQYMLGNCHMQGDGTVADAGAALRNYQAAAQQEHVQAQMKLFACHAGELEGEPDLPLAIDWLKRAAQQGFAEAQYELGKCYLAGAGVAVNRAHAASWYRKAERLGHVPAITGLGDCHFAADEAELGVSCYRRAATLGDAQAQFRLGECYLDGDGVRKNRSQALHWFELAEEQGHALAQDAIDDLSR